ncbi:MAG: WD40 repeat domain-containing protein [Thermoguttaceae bacterium]
MRMLASTLLGFAALSSLSAQEPRLRFTLGGSSHSLSSEPLSYVVFSPDGKTLVSGAGWNDDTIKLWDVANGELSIFASGNGAVGPVAFSPDGKTLVSGNGTGEIKVWDFPSHKARHIFQVQAGPKRKVPGMWDNSPIGGVNRATIFDVKFSLDGKTVVAGIFDGTVRLLDTSNGKEIAILKGHDDAVLTVAFSPDGKTVASGGWDKTIKLWDVATLPRKNTATFKGHSGGVSSVAFSPDGTSLVSGSHDQTIKFWTVATGKNTVTLRGHDNDVECVAFSPDGKTLVSGDEAGTIRLWDVATGKNTATVTKHNESVMSVAFSPDGKTLASGSWDHTIKLWDVTPAGKSATTLPPSPPGPPSSHIR